MGLQAFEYDRTQSKKHYGNHPEINSVELVGGKSLKELGIYSITPDDVLRIWEEEI